MSQVADKTKVFIVSRTEFRIVSIRNSLEPSGKIEILGTFESPAEAANKLELLAPDVLLVDVVDSADDAAPFVERTSKLFPYVAIVVLSNKNDVNDVRRYMRAGAKDYLYEPAEADALGAAILSIHARERERNTRHTMAVLHDHSTPQSQLIAFISAKGGVGKTTMSVNLAAALALQGKRTAVVDLDLQFGDASLLLNCPAIKNIVQMVKESSEIDPDVVERYMTTHASGVRLLSTGSKPEEAEYVTSADVRVLLQSLRKNYDYVIVDTAPLANDVFFAVLDTVDHRFMVSTLNLAVVKNNRLLLDLLIELGYDVTQVKHVLNRANAKNGLKVQDVAQILKTEIYAEIDNDFPFVETAANEGALFVQKDPQHRLTRQIYALTAKLDLDQGRVVSRKNPLRSWILKFSS